MPYKDHVPTKEELDRRNRREGRRSNASLFQSVPPTVSGASNRVGQQQPTTTTTERTGFPLLFEIDDRSNNNEATVNIDLSRANAHYHIVQISDKDADDNDIEDVQINFINAVKDRDIEFILILINNPDNETQPSVSFSPHLVGLPAGFPNAFEYVFHVAFVSRDADSRYDIINRGAASGSNPTVLTNLNENDIGEVGDITQIVNWEKANFHRFVATGDVNVAFTNPPDMGKWQEIILEITQDSDGARAITFGNTIANGTPTIDTDAGAVTRLRFYHRAGVYVWAPYFGGGAGSNLLSDLVIDTNKDWANQSITNIAGIAMSTTTGLAAIRNLDYLTWGNDDYTMTALPRTGTPPDNVSPAIVFDTRDNLSLWRFRLGASTRFEIGISSIDAYTDLDMNNESIHNVARIGFNGTQAIFGSSSALTVDTGVSSDLIFMAGGSQKGRFDEDGDFWQFQSTFVLLRPTGDVIIDPARDLIFREGGSEVGRYDGGDNDWVFRPPNDFTVNAGAATDVTGTVNLTGDNVLITGRTNQINLFALNDVEIRAGRNIIFREGATDEVLRYDGANNEWMYDVNVDMVNNRILNINGAEFDGVLSYIGEVRTIRFFTSMSVGGVTTGLQQIGFFGADQAITSDPTNNRLLYSVNGSTNHQFSSGSAVPLIIQQSGIRVFDIRFPTNTTGISANQMQIARFANILRINVPGSSMNIHYGDAAGVWRFSETVLTGPSITLGDTLRINDNDADPSIDGEFVNNDGDVKVHTGGKVVNLSDIDSDSDGNLIPGLDNFWNIGSSPRFWKDLYVHRIFLGNQTRQNGTRVVETYINELGGDMFFHVDDFGTNREFHFVHGGTDFIMSLRADGTMDMRDNRITDLGTPIADDDAATKQYVDDNGGGGGGARDRIESGNDSVIVGSTAISMRINNNVIWALTGAQLSISPNVSLAGGLTVAGRFDVFGNTTLRGTDITLDASDDISISAGSSSSNLASITGGLVNITASVLLTLSTDSSTADVSVISGRNIRLIPVGEIDVFRDLDMQSGATVDFSRTASVPSGSADGAIVVKVGGVDKHIPYYDT